MPGSEQIQTLTLLTRCQTREYEEPSEPRNETERGRKPWRTWLCQHQSSSHQRQDMTWIQTHPWINHNYLNLFVSGSSTKPEICHHNGGYQLCPLTQAVCFRVCRLLTYMKAAFDSTFDFYVHTNWINWGLLGPICETVRRMDRDHCI